MFVFFLFSMSRQSFNKKKKNGNSITNGSSSVRRGKSLLTTCSKRFSRTKKKGYTIRSGPYGYDESQTRVALDDFKIARDYICKMKPILIQNV